MRHEPSPLLRGSHVLHPTTRITYRYPSIYYRIKVGGSLDPGHAGGPSRDGKWVLTRENVDSIERHGNRRPPVERLVSAWSQESEVVVEPVSEPYDPLIAASAEPRRRTRTPLTDEEMDAMRTARANGVSFTALAKATRHPSGTVWAKTRLLR